MFIVSDEMFADLIATAIDHLPKDHARAIQNVAIVYAEVPTLEQREKLELRHDQTLFGLYEGVPLPRRNGSTGYGPDKITLFKQPMELSTNSLEELREQIAHTLWHEVAHYFGLDHEQIHRLE